MSENSDENDVTKAIATVESDNQPTSPNEQSDGVVWQNELVYR